MPRITIGDGSLYIEAPDLTKWNISPEQILSLLRKRRLDRVWLTVNGDKFGTIPVHHSVVVGFDGSKSLTISIVPPMGNVGITIDGLTFEDDRWVAVGHNVLRFNAPGVHIERVTIDATDYYQANEPLHKHLPFPARLRHRLGCTMSVSFTAVTMISETAASSGS